MKSIFTSSQLVKQVHLFGDRQTDLVPSNVADALKKSQPILYGFELKRDIDNKPRNRRIFAVVFLSLPGYSLDFRYCFLFFLHARLLS